MLKGILQRLALMLAGIMIAFAIAEVAIRVFALAPVELYTYNPYVGWKLKAGAHGWQTHEGHAYVEVNRDGFRGPDYSFAKPPGTLRIAVIGDSFTEAQHVAFDDTFCQVAQRDLQEQCPLPVTLPGHPRQVYTNVEVINFGCDGYGTAQELITLDRWAWRYSPDIVVLAFFSGNDMRNNSVVLEGDKCRPFYVERGGQLVLGGPFEDSWSFRLHCMLRMESRHSQVLNVLGDARSHLSHLLHDRTIRRPAAHRIPSHPLPVTELGLSDVIYAPPVSDVWRDAWRVSEDEIAMINRSVKAHGAILLVVTVPTGVQDNPSPDFRAKYMAMVGSSDLFYPDERIAAMGAADGYAVLNLSQPMQFYAQAHDVYLHGFPNTTPGTGHFNVEGHSVAGTLIAEKIRQLLSGDGSTAPDTTATTAPKSAAQ